jgi:hypothetical protein
VRKTVKYAGIAATNAAVRRTGCSPEQREWYGQATLLDKSVAVIGYHRKAVIRHLRQS